ncbi:MAG: class IV adenylate cyclase [Rectinemataceae bacterium]|nr:class IV adenylate cyclase [Rectinemataceae bacterium]
MFEIEMKAWVDDPVALKNKLLQIGEYLGKTEKNDSYWSLPGMNGNISDRKFRIREEDGIHTVTYKEKTVSGGMEVNQETEFHVSSSEDFIILMEQAGCSPLYQKHKTSEKYRVGRCLTEMVLIEGLGQFIEIEILSENNRPETIVHARNELFAVLDACGIARSSIESRFYSDLLAHADISRRADEVR